MPRPYIFKPFELIVSLCTDVCRRWDEGRVVAAFCLYSPLGDERQMKESSAPSKLGFMHWIWSVSSGKRDMILSLFHLSSDVSKSDTRRSLASSLIGPYGRRSSLVDIQESFQILVDSPLPITFPRWFLSRSLPELLFLIISNIYCLYGLKYILQYIFSFTKL